MSDKIEMGRVIGQLLMKIGYCRISTGDQILDLQKDALMAAGCEKIYQDIISGSKSDRPGLTQAMEQLRQGDTLVVWRLDRLGRSLKHLITLIEELESKDISFKSLTESLDTSTSGGKLIFQIFGAIAEFERNIIRERIIAGLKAARARGRVGGRKQKHNQAVVNAAVKFANENPEVSITKVCKDFGISRDTFYRRSN